MPASHARPLVSVVTPFYNTDAYLAASIESVLAQSYSNFELILVNNRSTDRSGEIAAGFASRDPRVRLIENPVFLDKVANYNFAMTQISPESRYTKVVQADDWILPHCLAEMVALAEEDPHIGLVSSYFILGTRLRNVGLPCTQSRFSGHEVCRMQLLDDRHFYFGNFTTVMLRSEIVRSRQPCYPTGTYNEDTELCYEVLRDWDFGFVHQVLSFTREGNESLSKSVERFNPNLADYFITMNRFGPAFLSPDEYRRRLERLRSYYLTQLGRAYWERRDAEFWRFHCDAWRVAGQALERRAVAKHAALDLLRSLRHPMNFARRMSVSR